MKTILEQALDYIHEKEYFKALDCYRQVEIDGLHGQAACMIRLGKHDEALRLLDRALFIDPGSERCLQLKSILLEKAGPHDYYENVPESYFHSIAPSSNSGRPQPSAAGPVRSSAVQPGAARPQAPAQPAKRPAAGAVPHAGQPAHTAHTPGAAPRPAAAHAHPHPRPQPAAAQAHAAHAQPVAGPHYAPQPAMDTGVTYLNLDQKPQPAPPVQELNYDSPWKYAPMALLVAFIVIAVNSFFSLCMNLMVIRYRPNEFMINVVHDFGLFVFLLGGVYLLLMKGNGFQENLSPRSAGMLAGLTAGGCGLFQFGIAPMMMPAVAAAMFERSGSEALYLLILLLGVAVVPALTGWFTSVRVRQLAE